MAKRAERVGLERQALRLLVGDHLQAMLDGSEEDIGLGELLDRVGGHPALGVQFAQHFERARAAQLGPAPAEDELLRLHEELDLANAAAPELDVVAGHGDDLVAAHRMDLPLHRVDVGDRGIVEIFAPDEGRELARGNRARARGRRRPGAP